MEKDGFVISLIRIKELFNSLLFCYYNGMNMFSFFSKGEDKGERYGFILIESLVGIAIFVIVTATVYQSYIKILNLVNASRRKITASALANEQLEIIHNLPYADVGLLHGLPLGKIQHEQYITRDNTDFKVVTTIRSIDDPFDGIAGGTPNDLSPADYKLVGLEISCASCHNFAPITFSTHVGPKNLETTSTNGALFIRVFDANGQPVPGADVHVENNLSNPFINIDDTTNNDGVLQIVDAPPGINAYEIRVSKGGYSREETFSSGETANPNPVKPHATVVAQGVTQISFAIDKVSTINVSSLSETCVPVSAISFFLEGTKVIGTEPDVLKYDYSTPVTTNGSGSFTLAPMEWDDYNFFLSDASYDLAGVMPLNPVNLAPDTTLNLQLIVEPRDPKSLLVTVKDASTQLPLADTSAALHRDGYATTTLITGRGFLRQTDWSGGSGQEDFSIFDQFYSFDGNIDTASPTGELLLTRDPDFGYTPQGVLISSTFDTGSASNFYQIVWEPQNQPAQTGENSVRIQIATNNDKTTWNFLGPDGTGASFYTLSDMNINAVHNGNRYLRYKIFLQTADVGFSPNISDVAFTFTSSCVPPGQILFTGLANGTYTVTLSKTGYQTLSSDIVINPDWQQYEAMLIPE